MRRGVWRHPPRLEQPHHDEDSGHKTQRSKQEPSPRGSTSRGRRGPACRAGSDGGRVPRARLIGRSHLLLGIVNHPVDQLSYVVDESSATKRSRAAAVPPPLHELESEVMEQLWRSGEASVRAVMDALHKRSSKERAYTTYMTIMARLHKKGMLVRRREGKADFYAPAYARDEYMALRARPGSRISSRSTGTSRSAIRAADGEPGPSPAAGAAASRAQDLRHQPRAAVAATVRSRCEPWRAPPSAVRSDRSATRVPYPQSRRGPCVPPSEVARDSSDRRRVPGDSGGGRHPGTADRRVREVDRAGGRARGAVGTRLRRLCLLRVRQRRPLGGVPCLRTHTSAKRHRDGVPRWVARLRTARAGRPRGGGRRLDRRPRAVRRTGGASGGGCAALSRRIASAAGGAQRVRVGAAASSQATSGSFRPAGATIATRRAGYSGYRGRARQSLNPQRRAQEV